MADPTTETRHYIGLTASGAGRLAVAMHGRPDSFTYGPCDPLPMDGGAPPLYPVSAAVHAEWSAEEGETPTFPSRDDAVAAWIREHRDQAGGPGIGEWEALDSLLDDYRLHADTGTPLTEPAEEGGYADPAQPRTWTAHGVDPARWLRGATSSGDPLFPAVRAVLAELEQHRAAEHSTVLGEVAQERARQDAKWGEQNHPDGTGTRYAQELVTLLRAACDDRHQGGRGTFLDILVEEVAEAGGEVDAAAVRAELIQVAAVAVAWVEAIDRRGER